ncbi:hypothetical protein N9L94_04705 [Robiginitalea sp.]|nr:hypothetical protein [Robiginitalea sp.]
MKKTIEVIATAAGLLGLSSALFVAFRMDDILFNRLLTCCLILAAILIIRLNIKLSGITSETQLTQSNKTDS